MSLLLATAIWFLIRNYIDELNRERQWDGYRDPQHQGERRPGQFFGEPPASLREPRLNSKTPEPKYPKAIPVEGD